MQFEIVDELRQNFYIFLFELQAQVRLKHLTAIKITYQVRKNLIGSKTQSPAPRGNDQSAWPAAGSMHA